MTLVEKGLSSLLDDVCWSKRPVLPRTMGEGLINAYSLVSCLVPLLRLQSSMCLGEVRWLRLSSRKIEITFPAAVTKRALARCAQTIEGFRDSKCRPRGPSSRDTGISPDSDQVDPVYLKSGTTAPGSTESPA